MALEQISSMEFENMLHDLTNSSHAGNESYELFEARASQLLAPYLHQKNVEYLQIILSVSLSCYIDWYHEQNKRPE